MEPDLDGYPILRIDQLSSIDIPTLERSIPDAAALMENLRAESNSGKSQRSMIKYLQKQLEHTSREIATRAAEDRVNSLLSGTKDLLVRAISPLARQKRGDAGEIDPTPSSSLASTSVPKPAAPTSSSSSSSSLNRTFSLPQSFPKKSEPPPVAFYEPIPLPSQLAAGGIKPMLSRTRDLEQEEGMQREKNRPIQPSEEVHTSRSSSSRLVSQVSSESDLLTSRSSGSVSTSPPPSHYIDISSGHKKPRRRADTKPPASIYSQANLTGASERQNQLSIQQNFGNAFMVGATEKKKRFYPKKVVKETEAEKRAKLQEKGRNQAMVRLLERKNKQIERSEEMKLRRLEEKNVAAKKRKAELEKKHRRMQQQRERDAVRQQALEKEQKQLKQQQQQQEKKRMEHQEEQACAISTPSGVSSGIHEEGEGAMAVAPLVSADVFALDEDSVVHGLAPLCDLDASASSEEEEEEPLSGDDDLAKAVVIAQTELDEVEHESVAVFDSYRLRNMRMRIDSDESGDDGNGNGNGEEKGIEENIAGGVEADAEQIYVPHNQKNDLVSGVAFEKNKAALNTLRKLKQKRSSVETESLTVPGNSADIAPNEEQDLDCFQGTDGVEDIVFANEGVLVTGLETEDVEEKNTKKRRKKKSKKTLINDDDDNDDGGDMEDVRRKRKTKKSSRTVVNEDGEEVEHEDRKARINTVKVVRTVVSEAGEEVMVEEEVEVRKKRKKKKKKKIKILSEDEGMEGLEDGLIERTVAESSASAPGSMFSTSEESRSEDLRSTVHKCCLGADGFPGLSAWVLASIDTEGKPVWSVDRHQLQAPPPQSPRHDSLHHQRSLTRQEVSYGIVLLARVCESLMMGKGFQDSGGADVVRFKGDWQCRVAQFDSIVCDLTTAQQDTLFGKVVVCGNTAAVVSKLEHLVTTAFRLPGIGQGCEEAREHEAGGKEEHDNLTGVKDDGDGDKGGVTSAGWQDKREVEILSEDGDLDSSLGSGYDDSDSDEDYLDHFSGAIAMLQSRDHEDSDGRCGRGRNGVDVLTRESNSDRGSDGDKNRNSISDNERGDSSGSDASSCSDNNESMVLPNSSVVFVGDKDLSGKSDDTSLQNLPSSATQFFCPEKNLRSSKDRQPRPPEKIIDAPEKVTSSSGSSSSTSKEKVTGSSKAGLAKANQAKVAHGKPPLAGRRNGPRDRSPAHCPPLLSMQDPPSTTLNGEPPNCAAVKITDVYKSIAEIFPAVRAKMDSMQASCRPGDHAILAKLLLESMHIQLKVYDDWLEVMDDYATVFCSDKDKGVRSNIAENSDRNSAVYSGGSAALHYRVNSSRPEVTNIIKDVFGNVLKGWEELPTGLGLGISWNMLWSWSKPKITMTQLLIWQRVNHFQNSKELTRKDTLKKNLQKYTSAVGNKAAGHFEIMPQTFLLPAEYTLFVKEYSAQEKAKADYIASGGKLPPVRNMWIVKPVGLSRGRGISMLEDLSSLTYSQSTVLQKYIDNPLCLDGYKFDLRIFVVVTSFQPLEAFIYRDGFARISTVKYTTDETSLSNLYIHLTNSSIQKHSESGPSKDNPLHISQGNTDESNGSKIGLLGKSGLWKRLEKYGVDVESMWDAMCLLIVKSLVVVNDKILNQPCNFELFGYDVLFDQDLRPWLIEVNSGPSLARENQLDIRVKNELVSDIIKLIDPPPFDRAALTTVLRRRINDLQQKKFSMTSGDPHLEQDLKAILGEHVPRRYGEEPKECGNFERLCPGTKNFNTSVKLKSKLVKAPAGMSKKK